MLSSKLTTLMTLALCKCHQSWSTFIQIITCIYQIIISSVISLLCKASLFRWVQWHFSLIWSVQRVTCSAVICQILSTYAEQFCRRRTWRTDATYPPRLHFLYLAPNKYRDCTDSSIQHTVRTPRHTTPGFFCVQTHSDRYISTTQHRHVCGVFRIRTCFLAASLKLNNDFA